MATPSDLDRIQGLIQDGEKILDSGQEVYVQEHSKIDKTKFFSWRTRASNLLSENFEEHQLTKQFRDTIRVGPGPLTDYPLRQALKILRTIEEELRQSSTRSSDP